MLIFLHGPDTYRLQQKLAEIEQQYRNVHGNALNLEKVDALQTSFQDFWDKLTQQSMFIKKKLFFIENVFSNEQFKNFFLKRIDDAAKSQHIIVCIEKQSLKKTEKLFRALEKIAKCQHFEELSGQKLRNWVKREFSKYGAVIEPLALDKLLGRAGNDLWALSNEIKKLSSYKVGRTKGVILSPPPLFVLQKVVGGEESPNVKVTEQDINLFIKPKLSAEIFKTIDALARGNKKTALQMLQNHLDQGDSPFYLLTMFAWQFRNLLLVKSSQKDQPSRGKAGSSLLKMKPFVFRKTSQLAQRFSFEQLKKIFNQILQTDLAVKTGQIPPEQALRMFIAQC